MTDPRDTTPHVAEMPATQSVAGAAPSTNQSVPESLGDFRIVREIGRGGMGVVYEAVQLSLGRRVALKVLRSGVGSSAELEARFQREAETVAQLHHTNIVPIFAVGKAGHLRYFAMQYIEGTSLVAVGELADAKQVADIGRQAAEALAHAHQRGIIHRDVKPSNLLRDPHGVVWLTDFGLARGAEESVLTAEGALVGTPRYMSPEQVAGTALDARTDIYSLGATLYELATGQPVLQAEGIPALLTQVRETPPVPPRQHRPDLPRDLETIILKCLAKEPEKRYENARQLADDLRAFAEDRAILARRPSLIERAGRWFRAQRFSTATLVRTGLAAGVVVAALAVWIVVLRKEMVDSGNARMLLSVDTGPVAIELPLTGELLHPAREQLRTPPFSVPLVAELPIKTGVHRLRLSRPGWLSATYPIFVESNVGNAQTWFITPTEGLLAPAKDGLGQGNRLYLPRQHVWHSRLEKVIRREIIAGEKGSDLLLIRDTAPEVRLINGVRVKSAQRLLERVHGSTGEAIWQHAREHDTPVPRLWRQHFPMDEFGLLQVGNLLLFASRQTATLLALEAESGKLAWVWTLDEKAPPLHGKNQWNGTVCGLPLHVPGEGGNVVVALLRTTEAPDYRWVALDPRSGKPRWLQPAQGEPAWKQTPDVRREVVDPDIALARVTGRSVVVAVINGLLQVRDVITGKPVRSDCPLAWPLVAPPRYADLDGDGNTEALLVHEDQPERLTLTAISLANQKTLWEASWQGVPEPLIPAEQRQVKREMDPDWPMVVDLDGDGLPEVILRQADYSSSGVRPRRTRETTERNPVIETLGVRVLSGQTGELRWQRSLGRSNSRDFSGLFPIRFLPGPPGRPGEPRDLFVASLLVRWRPGIWHIPEIHADALSGKDGSLRWAWCQPLFEDRSNLNLFGTGLGKLVWWQTGEYKLLLVPHLGYDITTGDNLIVTHVLDQDSGSHLHHLPAMIGLRAVDLTGDGKPDLVGTVPDRKMLSYQGSLNPIHGTAPETIAAAQRLKPGKRLRIGIKGKDATLEDYPLAILPDPKPSPDLRDEIPLPWDRFGVLTGAGEMDLVGEVGPRVILIVIPVLFVVLPLTLWWCAGRKRKLLRMGATPDQIRAQSRWWQRWALWNFVVALLLLTTTAIILLALDQERQPHERYIWTGWWFQGLAALFYLGGGLMLLSAVGLVLMRSVRPRRNL